MISKAREITIHLDREARAIDRIFHSNNKNLISTVLNNCDVLKNDVDHIVLGVRDLPVIRAIKEQSHDVAHLYPLTITIKNDGSAVLYYSVGGQGNILGLKTPEMDSIKSQYRLAVYDDVIEIFGKPEKKF